MPLFSTYLSGSGVLGSLLGNTVYGSHAMRGAIIAILVAAWRRVMEARYRGDRYHGNDMTFTRFLERLEA